SVGLADELLATGSELWNMYGPTETTIWSAVDPVRTSGPGSSIPIGLPIDSTTFYVLDPELRPVPLGVPGELHIGGAGVARGYRNRAELTAERFVNDPYSKTPSARMYRTGDLARWRADGTLEYLGRLDHQVKLRGFRIELGEVEAVLARHPSVAAAAAKIQIGAGKDPALIAYVAPTADGVDADVLRQSLAEH